MTMQAYPLPADQPAREAIVAERARNVAVIAGAGTGKTKTIIDRAVALLAPWTPDIPPILIQRMALITFTRRAAGELRFRIREELLRELEHEARNAGPRADRLRDALGNLDAAFVGTIHGFADRLLRLRPVEAVLSPAYALVEDNAELVRETFWRLRRAADAATLRAELGPHAAGLDTALVDAAADTLRATARGGMQMERRESVFGPDTSLEALLARMIDTRDLAFGDSALPDPQLEAARAAARRFAEIVGRLRHNERGHRRLRAIARELQRLSGDDPVDAFRIVNDALRGLPLRKSADFNNDPVGWGAHETIRPDNTRTTTLVHQLKGPHRWLGVGLVRLFPVVRAMYERVKAEHEVVDYLDLLIKLRDLLRDNLDARRFYQGLLDHIFVDEFQDTDPLQCEIVFHLCEDPRMPPAARWEDVQLAPGKLTIVGDPKQSIYRFRRADVAMYGRALERLRANGALEERLETNFRSRPELIAFFNQQLAKVLGKDGNAPFDPQKGRVNYEDLSAASTTPAGGVSVHVLPYADSGGAGLLAGNGRNIEATMLARYVRWLLGSGRRVRDPDTDEERAVQPGDIAVLACTTTKLRLLLHQFDAAGIPYAARGGALFLGHPVVRQYLLGLRALADRDDGCAQAALLRPPFFALDWADAVADRGNKELAPAGRRARMQEAQALITDLRLRRHLQSPGAVARDLIERTALARTVVAGDNGRQTLAALYEVAGELERRAALARFDYDAATEMVRTWATAPVFMEVPEPIHTDAVRVMTIHGAKGLEFPVVILWDGFQKLTETGTTSLWDVERDGHAWALSVGAVTVEEPASAHLLDRQRLFADQERRRMYYVAATRARDLLVLPRPLVKNQGWHYATTELLADVDPTLIELFETFTVEQVPLWSRFDDAEPRTWIAGDADLEERLQQARASFCAALQHAVQPIASPMSVTATAAADEITAESERTRKVEAGRFGPVFGSTVHRALELILSGACGRIPAAVTVAAQEHGLTDHMAEAEQDVERSMHALRGLGVGRDASLTISTEYPLAMPSTGGTLLVGFIDVLLLGSDSATVIDFKTDAPSPGGVATAFPKYAAQLRLYRDMLARAGALGTRRLRAGILLSATGELRWLAEP